MHSRRGVGQVPRYSPTDPEEPCPKDSNVQIFIISKATDLQLKALVAALQAITTLVEEEQRLCDITNIRAMNGITVTNTAELY